MNSDANETFSDPQWIANRKERAKTTQKAYRDHIDPDLTRLMLIANEGTMELYSEGSYVINHLGKRYLDFAGGYGVFSLGHRHPAVLRAVKEQLDYCPLTSKILYSESLALFAKELADFVGNKLQYSFVCNSGTEANEAALKFARVATGRPKIISFERAFHGKSLGSLSASGNPLHRQPFEPLLTDFICIPYGDCVALEAAMGLDVAAVIVEPIQGEGGIRIPPADFLPTIRQICTAYGSLLIVDEVQTGLGRTGERFAVDHYRIQPDLMTLAKGLSGGFVLIGVCMQTQEVRQGRKGKPTLHTSTFGGNPLACEAARATLRVIKQESLVARAAYHGDYLLGSFRQLSKKYPGVFKDVRGLGLMLGLEFEDEGQAGKVISEASKHGLLLAYTLSNTSVIRIEPPLTISKEELDEGIATIDACLQAL